MMTTESVHSLSICRSPIHQQLPSTFPPNLYHLSLSHIHQSSLSHPTILSLFHSLHSLELSHCFTFISYPHHVFHPHILNTPSSTIQSLSLTNNILTTSCLIDLLKWCPALTQLSLSQSVFYGEPLRAQGLFKGIHSLDLRGVLITEKPFDTLWESAEGVFGDNLKVLKVSLGRALRSRLPLLEKRLAEATGLEEFYVEDSMYAIEDVYKRMVYRLFKISWSELVTLSVPLSWLSHNSTNTAEELAQAIIFNKSVRFLKFEGKNCSTKIPSIINDRVIVPIMHHNPTQLCSVLPESCLNEDTQTLLEENVTKLKVECKVMFLYWVQDTRWRTLLDSQILRGIFEMSAMSSTTQ